jgi:adenine-specific DNA-methyltransferase
MRYLGCKAALIEYIQKLFEEKHLFGEGNTLFDAFCGTGTIAHHFKKEFNIILNDNLHCATTFASGRVYASRCTFETLGFNPFDFFNANENQIVGFFSRNYAPALSGRMYFSDWNAGRIDYFRQQIQEWRDTNVVSLAEYYYLLSALMESVSHVANVAGVYGAYLKTWDPRAVKRIVFMQPAETDLAYDDENNKLVEVRNGNIESIIEDIPCDILYLDPPYTRNSYSVQYHILETLILNDNPELRGVTGARSYENMSNDWSKPNKVEIVFDRVLAKTQATHIVFSYSSDGLMSKDYILHALKRYCYEDSVTCEEIAYKRYKNFKTADKQGHREYLFYGRKKPAEHVKYYCPLNYMGGKSPIIDFIKPQLHGRNKFVDLMGGGFNVGINTVGFNMVIYNDINFAVANILQMFKQEDTSLLLTFIEKTIKKYGLVKCGKDAYTEIREDYNRKYRDKRKAYWYLYVVILYGFQQQLRFNSSYEVNNPVGESGYSDSVKEKIVSFSRRLKEMNTEFHIGDYQEIDDLIDADTLVYVDPPYLITLGSYNDGKRGFRGWNAQEEVRLLSYLDALLARGCKVIISNVLEYKALRNNYLCEWIEKHHVEIIQTTFRGRNETLVIAQ